jgi:hypothetical protein
MKLIRNSGCPDVGISYASSDRVGVWTPRVLWFYNTSVFVDSKEYPGEYIELFNTILALTIMLDHTVNTDE